MYKLEHATPSDIPLIRQLALDIWPQTYSAILSKEQIDFMLDMMYSEASLLKQMNEGAEFLIAYENDSPVAFASYQMMEASLYKLQKIYVLASQQGKGTGRLIIDYIISRVKEAGASRLQLQVNRYNNAKEFYNRLGFTVIEEADFDIGNGYFMNDYIMEKTL